MGAPAIESVLPGSWLWACRAGFERDLAAELPSGRELAGGLVVSASPAARAPLPTFGRQGFPIEARVGATAAACAPVVERLAGVGSFALHAFVADTEEGNRLARQAAGLRASILRALPGCAKRERDATSATDPGAPIVQICLVGDRACVGALPAGRAVSPWPGGRALTKLPERAPSRSAMKLAEAFAWLGFGPEADDRCVDLGAAPGGWTWLLLRRGARVWAVDRARMHPDIADDPRLVHVEQSAFSYQPRGALDWVFCDMVWKPSEVSALLARWGKKRLCRFVLANLKLPMKHRVEAVSSACRTVAEGGFREVRARHLYHDRDEVTLAAWR